MLISDSHKFVFLHVPKTGGSSITAALAPYLRSPQEVVEETRGWQAKHHAGYMHATYAESKSAIPRGYKAFAVVRNPWDRYISMWKNRRWNPDRIEPMAWLAVRRKLSRKRPFARAQLDFVSPLDPVLLWGFERLQEGFDWMCDQVGLPRMTLPRRNIGPGLDWREPYKGRPMLADAVQLEFAADVQAFGYEGEGPRGLFELG